MSKRAQRRFSGYRKYKKRLKLWVNRFDHDDTLRVHSWKELEDTKWSKFLKNTPHPCSCEICSGESYDRKQQQKLNNKIIETQLDDSDIFGDDYLWDYWDEDVWQECLYWDDYYKNVS